MTTRKRIVIHGALAAGMLAVIGLMYAQLVGLWADTQLVPRTVAAADAPPIAVGGQLTQTLQWRLPFSMAALGFLFVAVGESLASLWTVAAPARPQTVPLTTVQREHIEQETQRILAELECQETLADQRAAEREPEESVSLFDIDEPNTLLTPADDAVVS